MANIQESPALVGMEHIQTLFATLRDDESAAILQLKILLEMGALRSVLGVGEFRRHAFEYNLGSGRADLVLFHRDCGISIIEAKASNRCGVVAAGIGQLFLYEAEARMKFKGPHAPKYVNKFLCAPMAAEDAMPIWSACRLAGVKFIHLKEFEPFKDSLSSAGLIG